MENNENFPMNGNAEPVGGVDLNKPADAAAPADPYAGNAENAANQTADPYAGANPGAYSGSTAGGYSGSPAGNVYSGEVTGAPVAQDPNKIYKVIAYITLVGLIISLAARPDKEDRGTKQHLNQALICLIICLIPVVFVFFDLILSFLSFIPFLGIICFILSVLGWLLSIGLILVGAGMNLWGLIRACMGIDTPMPVIGKFRLIK